MFHRTHALLGLVLLAPVAALAQDGLQVWQPPAQPAAQSTAPAAAEPAAPAAPVENEAARADVAPEAVAAPAPPAPPAAAAASANALIAPAPADKGQIVFYRESKLMGAAIGFKVREGDTELGKLRSGKYFVALVEPGRHEYNMQGEVKDVLPLEVEAGETYYVKASISMGILAGRPNLAPSDEASFLALSSKLKLAK